MGVLLSFFKGNLNFYKRNKALKLAAFAWIFQNGFLALSVLLRDLYYIERHGLPYKRIGVLFFLVMVLSGLFTIFLKIKFQKTNYFLVKSNAWVGVVLLVCGSMFHWDQLIAKYNLEYHDGEQDVAFLMQLSDKALPILIQNKERLKATSYNRNSSKSIDEQLEQRRIDFITTHQQHSWLSWNIADRQVMQFFDQTKLTAYE